MPLRIVVAWLLLLATLFAPLDRAGASDTTTLRDRAGGVELKVPSALLGTITQATHGMNWHSRDGRLNVDTLRFPPERSLESIREKLKAIPGRQISRERYSGEGLELEGTDRSKAQFLIRIEAQADGTKRGVSVVYPTGSNAALVRSARSVLDSMRVTGGGLSASPPAHRIAEPRPCHLAGDRAASIAAGITIKAARASDLKVAAGDGVELSWSIGAALQTTCRTPLYLVLSLAPEVRFAGDGFLALMPGAKGPFGIGHDLNRARVFWPLHEGAPKREGTLVVKPLTAGTWNIRAALVEVPSWTLSPRSLADLAGERAIIAAAGGEEISFEVRPNDARIVVEDQFTLETPLRTVEAVTGRYTLQVFPDYYRVLDRQSGELVAQRSGTDPEFSPTARFVSALLEDKHSLEIVDLISRTTVGGFRSEELGSYIGRGVLPVAWGDSDSFLITGPIKGQGQVYNTLVDRKPAQLDIGVSKHATLRLAAIRLDLENSGVAYRAHDFGGTDDAKWVSLGDPRVSAPMYESPLHAPYTTGSGYQWQLGGDVAFTHVPDHPPDLREVLKSWDGVNFATSEAREDLIRQVKERHAEELKDYGYLSARRVQHAKAGDGAPPRLAAVAATRLNQLRAAVRNPRTLTSAGFEQFADRLSRLSGLTFKQNLPKSPVRGPLLKQNYTASPLPGDRSWDPELAAVLIEHVNGRDYQVMLAKFMAELNERKPENRFGLSDVPAGFACEYYTPRGSFGAFVSPERIMGRTGWQDGSDRYWLIQQDCWGGSGWRSVQLGMLIKRIGSAAPEFVSLTGDRQDHIEQYGLNSAKLARGWMTADGVLLVAMPNRKILLHDINADKRIGLLEDVEGAEFAADIRLTSDGTRLILTTEGGRIGVYETKSGARLLGGYFIDDELILHNDGGYYLATPEGAHFVNVRFPGIPAYSTVHQFARTLDRPDAIAAILRGKPAPAKPDLLPPPQLQITASASLGATSRKATLNYHASSGIGLARLNVFVDGRLVRELGVTGTTASSSIEIPLPPEARWMAAVATDTKGYESMPQAQQLAGAEKPAGRLFVISVGTDRYDGMEAKYQLSGAVRDARSFKAVTEGLRGGRYKEVIAQELIDDANLKSSLPAGLHDVLAKSGPDDTVMVFAAGHGLQGRDGKFYLVTRASRLSALEATGIAWDEIGQTLNGARARVVVFLDACRSGSAASASSNDDVVNSLMARKTPLAVIAASKGRQDSEEGPGDEGGRFTNAVLRAITSARNATDINSNDVIELAELYAAVKREVVRTTEGRQTPWIARNQMVGEVPLF